MSSATAKLDSSLRAAHDAWLGDARQFLVPATNPAADFWTRWSAVRYLADEFSGHYRMERALMDRLRLVLPAHTATALAAQGDRVFRLRLEIDRIGRRRGTSKEFAAGAAGLLHGLEAWLGDIEQAVARIPGGAEVGL